MFRLTYLRIELLADKSSRIRGKWSMRVHKAPAMPDSVMRVSRRCWQRYQEANGMTVIETWRLSDAARLVA